MAKAEATPTSFCHCKPREITKRELESPLPMPFKLPRNFPPLVMCELKKDMLSIAGKTKFISAVAASMFHHKSYPTKQEYEHVGQQIIEKYPFLRSASGTGYVSYVAANEVPVGLSGVIHEVGA